MRNLADRVPPETRAELAAAADTLERLGPKVCRALEALQRATMDANCAVEMRVDSLDPAELAEATDDELDALESATGITRGWAAAFAVASAVHRVNA